jgi:hypothetical protein
MMALSKRYVVVILTAATFLGGASFASADSGSGAEVQIGHTFDDPRCMLGPPMSGGEFVFFQTSDWVEVVTPTGDVVLTCHFQGVGIGATTAVTFENFMCDTSGGTTIDTRYTVTPSGRGTLVCITREPFEPTP